MYKGTAEELKRIDIHLGILTARLNDMTALLSELSTNQLTLAKQGLKTAQTLHGVLGDVVQVMKQGIK